MPLASIVIRTLNESVFLPETLDALARQRFRDFETIVVDSGSTDGTLDVARRYPVRLIEITPEEFSYGRALNLGCREASGKFIVLLSAHALPADDGWLGAMLDPFQQRDVAGVVGRELPRKDCNPFDRRGLRRRYDGVEARDIEIPGSGILFGAANSAVRRSVWQEFSFDETLPYSEDFDWARRVRQSGYRLRYQPAAAAFHSHNETLGQIRRRFYNVGAADRLLSVHRSRYRGSALLLDSLVLPLYDMGYALIRLQGPRWVLLAPARRWAINFGRYAGYRKIARDVGILEATVGRGYVRLVDKVNRLLSARSPALARWTGKSPYGIHPKHLLPHRESRDWFLPYLPAGATLVDAGCGHGAHSITARRQSRLVVGFDRNPALVRIAATRARSEVILDSFFQVADAEKSWPYRGGTFDRVLALDILEHVDQRGRFLEECRRVLREDGRLLVAVPNRDTSWRRRLRRLGLFSFSDPDHKIEYTRQEIDEELKRAGFRVELCSPVVYDTPWYGVIDLMGGISLSLYQRLVDRKRREALEHPEESNGFRIVAAPS